MRKRHFACTFYQTAGLAAMQYEARPRRTRRGRVPTGRDISTKCPLQKIDIERENDDNVFHDGQKKPDTNEEPDTMTAKHLPTWLRRLVPESPKCARFAAGSALAALALQALCHLASLWQAALARLNAWLLTHGLRDIPPCDPPADGTIPVAPVTYQPAIMGATVMAFALLAVAHTVRVLGGEDREGKEKVSARRRGLIGAAAVLGGMQIAMSVIGVFVLRTSAIGSLCSFFGSMAAYFSSLALGIGVAVLPFCLLRLHGSVLKAPCDGADLRKLERLLSLAFGVCVAVVSADIIKDAVFWIPRSPYPFLVGASFLFALLTPLAALCVLWSCLTLLRGAAAGMSGYIKGFSRADIFRVLDTLRRETGDND